MDSKNNSVGRRQALKRLAGLAVLPAVAVSLGAAGVGCNPPGYNDYYDYYSNSYSDGYYATYTNYYVNYTNYYVGYTDNYTNYYVNYTNYYY